MPDIQNHRIDPQGEKWLKQIEKELPHMNLRKPDVYGNLEYEPNEILNAKVKPLLVNLQSSVCNDATYTRQVTIFQQHQDTLYGEYRNLYPSKTKQVQGTIFPFAYYQEPNPGGPQQPGSYTYYLVDTDLTPELDCIFVA